MKKGLKIASLIALGIVALVVISYAVNKVIVMNLPNNFTIFENGILMKFSINDKGQFVVVTDTDNIPDTTPSTFLITRKQYSAYHKIAMANKSNPEVPTTGV